MIMKEMFKLAIGDRVIHRNGSESVIIGDDTYEKLAQDIETIERVFTVVKPYGDSLLHVDYHEYDIMKVFRHNLDKKCEELVYERVEKPKTIYDLKYGDKYWRKSELCYIVSSSWTSSELDERRLEVGNIFLTQEECEFSIEEDKVRAIMRKYACTDKELLNNRDCYKYHIECCDNKIDYERSINCISCEFNYETKEIAQQVIDEIGEERLLKYYFKVV